MMSLPRGKCHPRPSFEEPHLAWVLALNSGCVGM